MEQTIATLNQMLADHIFASYAIGGGIAAIFYIEPVATFDLDVFVLLPDDTGGIVSLSSIYSWLEKHGYKPDKEQVTIEGVPVQFIPAYNDLVRDAIGKAVQKNYGNTLASVATLEYLMAIMLQTGRSKDRDRLMKFMAETDFDEKLLSAILEKHHLTDVFREFKRKYYGK